jgi:hypothetical protein
MSVADVEWVDMTVKSPEIMLDYCGWMWYSDTMAQSPLSV